jgi:hypothetical protein
MALPTILSAKAKKGKDTFLRGLPGTGNYRVAKGDQDAPRSVPQGWVRDH